EHLHPGVVAEVDVVHPGTQRGQRIADVDELLPRLVDPLGVLGEIGLEPPDRVLGGGGTYGLHGSHAGILVPVVTCCRYSGSSCGRMEAREGAVHGYQGTLGYGASRTPSGHLRGTPERREGRHDNGRGALRGCTST